MIASLSSKGQVTVPAEVRRKLGLQAGSKVDFLINEHDHLEMIPVAKSVKDLKGIVPKPEKPISLEEMDAAIQKGVML